MAEFIDRQAAIDSLLGWAAQLTETYGKNDEYVRCLESAAYNIEQIPAADVRPVVLCRDCDCWNDWDSAGKESLGNYVCSCAHWTVEDGAVFYTRPTDFCSYGEKRDES